MRPGSRWAAGALALLLAGSGCGYEGELPTTSEPPSPPAAPSEAAIAVSLNPSPIDATVTVDGSAPWSAEWTLDVQETAGIGGNIDFARATLTDSTGEPIAETELDAGQVSEQLGGSNRIQGGGNQALLMSLSFDFPEDTVSSDLLVTLELSDDRGNTVTATVEDVIHVCVPRLLSPDEGATLDNGCTNGQNGTLWEFDWSDCPDAEVYELYLELRGSVGPFNHPGLTESEYAALENRVVFEEARFGWIWKVRAKINDIWSDWSPERSFDVEPIDTDCPTP